MMYRVHQSQPTFPRSPLYERGAEGGFCERGARQRGVTCGALLFTLGLLICWTPALAHHGGLGIEGDLVQWALKVDQWQDENIAQGHRIKFLSYPRQPVIGNGTRLVFEIQSTATGQYVSGLTAELEVRAPDGTQRLLPLPEVTGAPPYTDTTLPFN